MYRYIMGIRIPYSRMSKTNEGTTPHPTTDQNYYNVVRITILKEMILKAS